MFLKAGLCLATLLMLAAGTTTAQCVSDPVLPASLQFDVDYLFAGLDRSLGGQFPQWLSRYNARNTTDPSPAFAGEDNCQNGIPDDDHLDLLGAILDGEPAGTVLSGLSPANVTDIRSSFAANRAKVRPDLTLTIVFVSVNIIDEIDKDDPTFGESLQDLVAAYMTIGDAESVTYIGNLLITLGEIFIEKGVQSGAIPSIVEGLVKDTLRTTVTGNFVATRYACFGDAPGASKPNLLGDTGSANGSGTTNEAAFAQAGGNRQAWLVNRGVALPPIQIVSPPAALSVATGAPATLSAVLAGGNEDSLAYDWKRVDATGATTRAATTQSLAFQYALPENSGDYALYACDGTWIRASLPAGLNVTPGAFRITTQPQGASRFLGQGYALSVTVRGGTAVPVYQWYFGTDPGNLQPVPAANGSQLVLQDLTFDDSGYYQARITGEENEVPTTLTSATVQVTVTNTPDVIAPQVTLLGANPLVVECGEAFSDPGATAMDDRDGDLTPLISVSGSVDTSRTGITTLIYRARDSANNTGQATRVVQVKDTTAPVLSLFGGDEIIVPCKVAFVDPGFAAEDACAGDLTDEVEVSGTINTAVTGTYLRSYSVSDVAGNTVEALRTVHVADTTPPVLGLLGGSTVVVECGGAYLEPGFTATDSCEGNLSGSVAVNGSADLNTPGDYTLTYTATDGAGNTTQVQRTVAVRDRAAPVLTLLGAATVTLECGGAFNEPGFTAMDACAGDLTAQVQVGGALDIHRTGDYPRQYTVTDAAGNQATASRTIKVVDTVPPVITLNGANPLVLACGQAYSEPGATAQDGCQGVISAGSITISGAVDTSTAGLYTRTYRARDRAGNLAEATRTVQVLESASPEITLLGDNPLVLACGAGFTDPGATAASACAGDLTADVVPESNVNPEAPGSYTVTYRLASLGENSPAVVRSVLVQDLVAPVLSLIGPQTLHVACGGSFADPGANAEDACEGDLSDSVVVSGAADVGAPGTYTLTYRVIDGSGNQSEITRTVEVADDAPPTITLEGDEAVSIGCDETFTDPGASAEDACEGPLEVSVTGAVAEGIPGTYTLTYRATDSAGNAAQSERTVTIQDTGPPRLTLLGDADIVLACGEAFGDPGASAEDSCDGTVPAGASIPDGLAIGLPGEYTVVYTAVDAAGNSGTASRRVVIQNNCAIRISRQPQSLSLYVGMEARLLVAATGGSGALNYRWWKDGTELDAPDAPQLVVANLRLEDGGEYTCVVSDGATSLATEPATLAVFERPAAGQHAGDSNGDWSMNLSEVLRIIQFFNVGSLQCSPGTEDGFAPGTGDTAC
ncbi:MAG: DUF5011 domain-containing protein, partial [Candidatus Hydrogenedentes bacterium]|nr:DUF5011 domain-containing protein [Candidatus Hydrogenedentota bacterium]